MAKIDKIKAIEILDSRGNPTVKAIVILDNGISAEASVPSGASKGTHEAVELRDNDPNRYSEMGVLKAIENIEKVISPTLRGLDPIEQKKIDKIMIDLDGSENKNQLGANSILAVSLAVSRAAAISFGKKLYQHIADLYGNRVSKVFPTPMFNVINGGLHGCGSFNFQEFMIIPKTRSSFDRALRDGAELYHDLKTKLKKRELIYSVGDEGGFTPNLETNREVLKLLKDVVGDKVFLGLDMAASTFYHDGAYEVDKGKKTLSQNEYVAYLKELDREFNFLSFEDLLTEDDWAGWQKVNAEFGSSKMIIGDDLLVTNKKRLAKAIETKACNSILVKVNQIGTLTETLEVIKLARKAVFKVIISHRSGETNDNFIADLAVGVGADYVKFGAPARGERVSKYNRLLSIYHSF